MSGPLHLLRPQGDTVETVFSFACVCAYLRVCMTTHVSVFACESKIMRLCCENQREVVGVGSHVCEENQFKHNQKLRGIKATVMR